MKHPISAVLCILAIIVGTHANLSPSFSFTGSGTATVTDGSDVTTYVYTRYDYAIDVTRGLLALNVEGTIGGQPLTEYLIVSINDSLIYSNENGVCTTVAFAADPRYPFSYQDNFWGSIFDNAVVNPPGTYTVTIPPLTILLVTVNGLPTTLTYTYASGTVSIATAVVFTDYINEAPPFSTFPLPAACSQFTCNSCYSSAIASTGSLLLLILAIAVQYTVM